jgi:DNA-binding NarL/FixJ family response regulator
MSGDADGVEGREREMKILICDRQLMLAEALAFALDARGYDVLAVTATVGDALSAVDCTPDICLLGLPPGDQLSGPDAVRAILQHYPGTKVLVLSEVTDPGMLPQLMRSGVAGLTHQDQSVAQIASALDAIEAGRNVLDPGPLPIPSRDTKRLCELSPREREIVARIAGGQSTRQMSFAMNITVDTVRTYVKNVLAKLGAHSRLQLAALASRDGLLLDQAPAAGVLSPAEPAGWAPCGSLPEERAAARRRGW